MTPTQNETMTLCQPHCYKGIEFIKYSDLSHEELILLRKVSDGVEIFDDIKKQMPFETVSILINGEIVQNCILYKDYLQWRTKTKPLTNTKEISTDSH